MKKSHDTLDEFPKEEVRSAIQAGIVRAEEQMNNKINKTYRYKMNKGKRKLLYAMSSVSAVFGILVVFLSLFSSFGEQFVANYRLSALFSGIQM